MRFGVLLVHAKALQSHGGLARIVALAKCASNTAESVSVALWGALFMQALQSHGGLARIVALAECASSTAESVGVAGERHGPANVLQVNNTMPMPAEQYIVAYLSLADMFSSGACCCTSHGLICACSCTCPQSSTLPLGVNNHC